MLKTKALRYKMEAIEKRESDEGSTLEALVLSHHVFKYTFKEIP